MTAGPERCGPERPGPEYPPEWDCEPDGYEDAHPCQDCGCMCAPHEWACWRCGAVQGDES